MFFFLNKIFLKPPFFRVIHERNPLKPIMYRPEIQNHVEYASGIPREVFDQDKKLWAVRAQIDLDARKHLHVLIGKIEVYDYTIR